MKRVFSVLFMLLLVVCLCGCGVGGSDTIKLGSSGPLSGSASIYGQAVEKGVKLAIEEINKAGGVNVNGKMMEFVKDGEIYQVLDTEKLFQDERLAIA